MVRTVVERYGEVRWHSIDGQQIKYQDKVRFTSSRLKPVGTTPACDRPGHLVDGSVEASNMCSVRWRNGWSGWERVHRSSWWTLLPLGDGWPFSDVDSRTVSLTVHAA
jgi:hypothetical protein